jgi:hypothetical protein
VRCGSIEPAGREVAVQACQHVAQLPWFARPIGYPLASWQSRKQGVQPVAKVEDAYAITRGQRYGDGPTEGLKVVQNRVLVDHSVGLPAIAVTPKHVSSGEPVLIVVSGPDTSRSQAFDAVRP